MWGEVPPIGPVLAYLVNLDVWCEEGVRVGYEGPVRACRSAAVVLLGVEGDPEFKRHGLGDGGRGGLSKDIKTIPYIQSKVYIFE